MSYGELPIQSWKQKVDALETLLFASLRSALSERGGVSSTVISFHPHGKIRICGHPSHLRHLRAIIHPGVFCGESMLAPRLHFKKNVLQHVLIIKCLRYTLHFSSKKVFELFGQN